MRKQTYIQRQKQKIKDSYIHKTPQPQEIRGITVKNVSVVIILRFFNMQKSGIFVVIFRLGCIRANCTADCQKMSYCYRNKQHNVVVALYSVPVALYPHSLAGHYL